jgi:Zn-dependent M28 family amino/carboxypeptidase
MDAANKPQNAFPELKLRFRFNQDAAARMFASSPVSFAEVLAKADAGEAQGFDLPGMLTLSATTGLRRTESMNVLAVLPGSDPRLKREYIVVTAHLDHLGRGAAVNGDAIYNGAHDNALGVAILLEMARALSAMEPRPRRSILFAAVTAEEKGLLGSEYLVSNPPFPADSMVANMNMDMPLLLTPTTDFVALGADHSSLGNSARAAALAQGYKLSADRNPEEVSFIRSDQFSFVRNGIPSIILKGGYLARDRTVDAMELQKDFRKVHYHQPSDDRNVPMDFAGAADLARINLRILQEVANANARPRWKRGDFFASRFAKTRQ